MVNESLIRNDSANKSKPSLANKNERSLLDALLIANVDVAAIEKLIISKIVEHRLGKSCKDFTTIQ